MNVFISKMVLSNKIVRLLAFRLSKTNFFTRGKTICFTRFTHKNMSKNMDLKISDNKSLCCDDIIKYNDRSLIHNPQQSYDIPCSPSSSCII